MQPSWQIPRTGLFWLLIAVMVVVAMHAEHLPLWVTCAAGIAIIWHIQVYRGVWRYPGRLAKFLLLSLCAGGLLLEYRSLLGLEPMVALLLSGLILKLLEMHRRRDALIVVYLGFFAGVVEALFYQTIGTALYILLSMLATTCALVGLNQSQAGQRWFKPLRIAGVALLQAIPLMIILFMVMPRIGSLWAVPMQKHGGVTGISDRMSPGDIARLGQSSELAFRVGFEGAIPAQKELYWRGLVLSRFDGRAWTQLGPWGYDDGWETQWYGDPPAAWDRGIERLGSETAYDIILEATHSPWLFALGTSVPGSHNIALTRDNLLVSRTPVATKVGYRARSWLHYRNEAQGLPGRRRALELALPSGFNPATLALAKQWRQEASSPEELIQRLMRWYHEAFTYTLRPPALGEHTVDEFLFDTKRGFCEHFASSFVFFMRAAGIPARVVAGYQGGERHPTANYLTVRQYDAHAWAEVWLAGRGWVQMDPTAAVAPQRIEQNFSEFFANEEGFLENQLFALERYRHIGWINGLRLKLDMLDYAWATRVLGYERIQHDVLTGILGELTPLRLGLFLLLGGALALAPLGLMYLFGASRQQRDELDQLFITFCSKLERVGLPRQIGEGPRDYAARVARLLPACAQTVIRISRYFEAQRYGDTRTHMPRLRQAIRRFSPPRTRPPGSGNLGSS